MGCFDPDLFMQDLVGMSIEFIQKHEPPDGYHVAFSGGKDSIVLLDLVRKSGVKHHAYYSVTTIDPPELVAFIKECYPDVEWIKPKRGFFATVRKKKILPLFNHRYCCSVYKERPPKNTTVLTGLRSAESVRRANTRDIYEQSYKSKTTKLIHPIIDWGDQDIWEYIHKEKMSYCKLYDEGFKRLGCIGCPLISRVNRERDFKKWPNMKRAWKKVCDTLVKDNGAYYNKKTGKLIAETGEELFNWWMDSRR